jgi:hypothetical protein
MAADVAGWAMPPHSKQERTLAEVEAEEEEEKVARKEANWIPRNPWQPRDFAWQLENRNFSGM